MKVKNNSFPYPVLSNFSGDYHNEIFDLEIIKSESFNQLFLLGKFKLTNEGLKTLIKENKAEYLVHVECGFTSYRHAYTYETNTFKIPIENDQIKGLLEINGFIIAKEDIKDYYDPNLDEMYEDMHFNIDKGNILAVTDRIEAILHETDDDFKDMTSIISIRKSETDEFMKIDNETDKIIVILPKKSYELYANYAKSAFKEVIITNVIFPALIHVFAQIEQNRREYEENRWYQVLKNILEKSEVNIETIGDRGEPGYIIVQKLLQNPVLKSLEAIKLFSESGGE